MSLENPSLRDRWGKRLKTSWAAVLAAMILVLLISGGALWLGNVLNNVPLALSSILLALLMISGLLWLRRSSWREFGLRRPKNWTRTLLLAVGGVITIHVLVGRILSPLVIDLTNQPVDISRFDALRGNLTALISGLIIVWTLAAFGEEMIFRGFVLNRIVGLFKNKNTGWAIALVLTSIVFGMGHFYQGLSGIILTGIVGVIYAFAYLADRCNLWVPILSHGLYDTSAFLIIFFNLDKSL